MTIMDMFKINWTEKTKKKTTTSITGFGYQIKSWIDDYEKNYPANSFGTKVIASVDNTVTVSISRHNSIFK